MRPTATILVAAILGALGGAQDRATPESRAAATSIQAQIKSLDHDSFEVRTKAMEELRAAGERARADLEAAKKSDSLEVRTRADSLLRELDAKKSPQALRPLAPEADNQAQRGTDRKGGAAPRLEDFSDPNAFIDALGKWMEQQLDRDARFPTFVFPEMKELDPIGPSDLQGGMGSLSITTQKDGEIVTFKNGTGGTSIKVQKKNDAGENVVESFEAKDIDEFKAKYPEIWAKYKPDESGMTWTVRTPGRKLFKGGGGLAPPPPFAAIENEVAAPRLGVVTSPVPQILDKHLKLKGEGVVIDSVSADSLAAKLGIREQDVLVALEGETIRSREDIVRVMARKAVAPTATAKVVREGALMELSATR